MNFGVAIEFGFRRIGMRRRGNNFSGFTLVELLVVIAIVGLLVGTAAAGGASRARQRGGAGVPTICTK